MTRLGATVTLRSAKHRYQDKQIKAGLRTASWQDQELVNTYGVGARVFTFKSSDFAQNEHPQKFDKVTFSSGQVVVLAAVFPVDLCGKRIGYKAYARGDLS